MRACYDATRGVLRVCQHDATAPAEGISFILDAGNPETLYARNKLAVSCAANILIGDRNQWQLAGQFPGCDLGCGLSLPALAQTVILRNVAEQTDIHFVTPCEFETVF